MKIFQSYPSENFKEFVSDLAVGINYSLLPQGTEYDLFKYVFNNHITGDEPWGLVSWKFSLKSAVDLRQFYEYCFSEINQGADCVFINPMIANESIFLNVWEQWSLIGPTSVKNLYSYLVDKKLIHFLDVMDKENFSFCNYFVATRGFWVRYFAYVDKVLSALEHELIKNSEIGQLFRGNAGYLKNPSLTMKPFIVERLFSTFICENKDLKAIPFRRAKDGYIKKLGLILGSFCKEMSDLKTAAVKNNDFNFLNEWHRRRLEIFESGDQFSMLLNMDDPSLKLCSHPINRVQ